MAVSSLLPPLLPAGIFSEETRLGQEYEPLFPEEAELIARAVDKRRQEFAAGRSCARRALGALGFPAAPLLANDDRSPIWPRGAVGSITHTGAPDAGWCAAAVGSATEWQGIGIDAELGRSLKPELWSRVLVASEQRLLGTLSSEDAGLLATLVFCAKEAFYKCQYPTTRTFIGFQEAEIELDRTRCLFQVRWLPGAAEAERSPEKRQALSALPVLLGQYCITPELVVAALTWPKNTSGLSI